MLCVVPRRDYKAGVPYLTGVSENASEDPIAGVVKDDGNDNKAKGILYWEKGPNVSDGARCWMVVFCGCPWPCSYRGPVWDSSCATFPPCTRVPQGVCRKSCQRQLVFHLHPGASELTTVRILRFRRVHLERAKT